MNSPSRKKGKFESLVGRRFGKLKVVSYAGRVKNGRNTTWNCQCDCGKKAVAVGSSLKAAKVISCGCFRFSGKIALRHGHSANGLRSPEYRTWQGILRRCTNPNEINYHRYGGRGIAICKRWENSFEAFLADVGKKPSSKHSIGRIDNDGDYKPGNVRWETAAQQNANTSRTRNFTIGKRTQNLASWVRESGLHPNTVRRRLNRGLSIEEALRPTPASGRGK
jgi:hypothetical protein